MATTKKTEPAKEIARKSALDDMVPEIMAGGSAFDEDQLRDLSSFEDAARMVAEAYGDLVSADTVLGDGFTLLESKDKALLCGLPLILMEWAFRDGDHGRPFASVRVMARNKDGGVSRYIFNDGSTGIAEQLAKYTKRTGKLGGLVVKNGLRRSDYDYEEDGVTKQATTYYLDTSA